MLTVEGEVDTLTAPHLADGLTRLLDDERSVPVVDLAEVSFLASSGLAVLIHAAHRATGQGRTLHVVATSRSVTRPLEITGSDRLFEMHADPAEVLGLGGGAGSGPRPPEAD
ncbi:MAG: STAS domain-containing protein [Pseudonocardia sp.]|nr:STAS domain-containing protein [Pseudonocardia sp.]